MEGLMLEYVMIDEVVRYVMIDEVLDMVGGCEPVEL